jgi:pimeloyl-ACP methyl ester carboxylesterase
MHMANADIDDPFALRYFDALAKIPAGAGRLALSANADKMKPNCPPLIFVPGGYHGAWCFALWMRELEQQAWPSGAIDVRGHGGLQQNGDFPKAGVEAMAADVKVASGHLDEPPILCGHSLGALLVAVAAQSIEVAGLVLLAPSPPGNLPGAKKVPTVSDDAVVQPPSIDEAMQRFYPRWNEPNIASMLERLTPESPRLLNDRYQLRIPVDAGRINAPALCISTGLDDHARHPPGQDEAVATFYGADHHHLPNASHCLMVDPDWHEGLDIILNWWRAR